MRRRHQQHQQPIVCDEISQHDQHDQHASQGVHEVDNKKDPTDEADVDIGHSCEHTRTASPTTTAASTAAGTGSIRAEPQLPSCRVVPPKQSCMLVKSFEDSIHSLGLTRSHHRHRPSGKGKKRAGTCTKHGRRDTGCTADLSHNTCVTCSSVDDDLSLSVSFSTIEVREFPVVIGDNPSCAMGPPLSIDWEPDCELSIPMNEFEDYRNGQGYDCCRRRTGEELRLDSDQRRTLVRNAGSSNHDIANAVRQVNRDRRARRRSIHNNLCKPFYAFDVVKESATRKFKRLVMGQKKDSVLYDEYTRACMHKESRRRELATMTIVEEEAAAEAGAEAGEGLTSASASAIVIQEDSTHRGGTHFYDECGTDGTDDSAQTRARTTNKSTKKACECSIAA